MLNNEHLSLSVQETVKSKTEAPADLVSDENPHPAS